MERFLHQPTFRNIGNYAVRVQLSVVLVACHRFVVYPDPFAILSLNAEFLVKTPIAVKERFVGLRNACIIVRTNIVRSKPRRF